MRQKSAIQKNIGCLRIQLAELVAVVVSNHMIDIGGDDVAEPIRSKRRDKVQCLVKIVVIKIQNVIHTPDTSANMGSSPITIVHSADGAILSIPSRFGLRCPEFCWYLYLDIVLLGSLRHTLLSIVYWFYVNVIKGQNARIVSKHTLATPFDNARAGVASLGGI